MNATETSGWKSFWNRGRWWKAIVAVVAYLALYQLAGFGIAVVAGDQVETGNLLATPASVFFGLGAGLVVGAVVLVGFAASVGWLRPLFSRQPVAGRWWMWIFVVLLVIPIVLRFAGIDYDSYGTGVVVTMLFTGLFIGFTEELLYRGIVVKILRNAGHRELSVAALSSLFFALSHSINIFAGQPAITVALTVVFTFGFGMMMYLVMRATGNIVWAMLIHAITDPTTILASGALDASTGAAHSPILDLATPFNIIFVIAGVIVLFFIRGKAEPVADGLTRR
ncbi:CAAX prenyl protease-like protein [Glaciihabitans tibetensis]|uniref:CAAX prenyl protease-like protein n=1 Tax=Glaciihabitans tibetensis TaxID=1266600 RepID=A0A2T0VFY8_9MICO|nr:CPBP family intramembrane glutamic endopeptidase [Glaciihabitans tibetensis]PRY69086.1 CAAX prenyl protease-like protein [Glaciihabitans tibetensis]